MSTAVRFPLHLTVLGNGMRVVVSPDPAVPVVAVNLWFDVGSRDEQPGRTGLAHLFEHLMFEGSAHVAAGEHLAIVQSVGGSANATTWFDRTNYFETVPTHAFDLALWLEADRLSSLRLGQDTLDNQRAVVLEEKRQRYDNIPYGDVLIHLVGLTFPDGHPYAHPTIGSMDDLAAASLDDVRAFFATHYAPDNAVLTIVGDVTPDQAAARADHYLGAVPPAARSPRPATPPLPPLEGLPRADVSADVPTDAAYATWRLPARDTREFTALELALAVLGDGQTSRLHRRLVRTDTIAEGAGASTLGLIGGTSIGFAQARGLAGVPAEQLEDAIVDEVARLVDEGPLEAEVDRAKAQFERAWLDQLGSFDSRADLIGCYATLYGDPDLVNRHLDEVRGIGLDEVAAAAGRWLRPEQRAMLSYRKESA
ncbi:MAG: pitrilysin family protein [Micropruina sp.]|uniref:M16 family metallopeptidase n=1 Tax=Micropruina sp. TaxID=2737536 RepID=UPI0039E31623